MLVLGLRVGVPCDVERLFTLYDGVVFGILWTIRAVVLLGRLCVVQLSYQLWCTLKYDGDRSNDVFIGGLLSEKCHSVDGADFCHVEYTKDENLGFIVREAVIECGCDSCNSAPSQAILCGTSISKNDMFHTEYVYINRRSYISTSAVINLVVETN